MRKKAMKTALLLPFLLFGLFICAASDDKDSTNKHSKKPWIHVVKYKENVMVLNAENQRNGLGLYNFYFPKRILGEYEVTNSGLQFIPFSETPPDMTKKEFNQYWNDEIEIERIFIPFTDIKKVKKWYGVKIKMRNGKKYLFTTNHPKKMVEELQSHLTNQN